MTVRSWSIDDIHGRLMIRRRMLMEEDYSIKAEAYKCVLDAKKKKRKGKSKSPGKGAKAKAPATPAIKPKPAIQPTTAGPQDPQVVQTEEAKAEKKPATKAKASKGKSASRPKKK